MTVRPIFAWYDLWVGVFIDRPKGRIYVFLLPCLGFVITRKRCGHGVLRDAWCAECEGAERSDVGNSVASRAETWFTVGHDTSSIQNPYH